MTQPTFNEGQVLFFEECDELLTQVEAVVLELQEGAGPEPINRCFRVFHSIKGNAAMTGFHGIARFTHHVESVLDKVRAGQLAVSSELVAVVLASKDHLEALVSHARGGPPVPDGDEDALVERLGRLAPAKAWEYAKPAEKTWQYQIGFRPKREGGITSSALVSLFDDLRTIGALTVVLDDSAVPPLDALEPSHVYLSWELLLVSTRPIDAVRDVFIFVASQVELTIDAQVIAADDEDEGFGFFVPLPPRATVTPAPPLLVETKAAPAIAAAASPPTRSDEKLAATKPTDTMVRVSSAKLDFLVNLVSELVITQSRLVAVASTVDDPELAGPVEEVERLVGELREGVLGIRMMPIGSTFGRFKRLVHDLSVQLGKSVDLVTEGADTELDKSVLDQLVDPLMHLVRNSLDHGIEDADVRLASGKPARGTIRLVARHAGQHVVVTIEDDGKGLDVDAIRAKGIERGLISAEQALPPSELFKLIFQPGFSTARALTDVSGRGVGMDVVKRQIDALRGTVRMTSDKGRGTTISLELPLTLAIIDGLLVEVAGDRYIMPLSAVTETVELPPGDRQRRNGNRVVAVRDELVPYISLRDVFSAAEDEFENEKVVILNDGDERVGLVVDHVFGGHQTVIQTLGPLYAKVDVVSGATIMGDGRVALILDIPGIVRLAGSEARDERASGPARRVA